MSAILDDLARLACVYSRTFGVCLACPHGSCLPGMGTKAVAWYSQPDLGEYGLCAAHDQEWAAAPAEEGQ